MGFLKQINQKTAKWSLLIFLLWASLLSFTYVKDGNLSYVKIHDNADGRMALRLAIRDDIENHEFGLWDPSLMGGLDRIAQGNSLDITNLIFLLFPSWLGYGLYLFMQRFIAGYFIFKLLHEKLKIQPVLVLFPAMFYSLFPQNQINNQFDGFTLYDSMGLPAIPLMLFLFGKITEHPKLKTTQKIGLIFFIGVLFASISHFAFTIFFFPLLLGWIFITSENDWKSSLWFFLVFTLGWLSIENFEIFASATLAPLSHRSIRNTCETFANAFDVNARGIINSNILNAIQAPLFIYGTIGSILTFLQKKHRRLFGIYLILIGFVLAGLYAKPIVCYLDIPVFAPLISIAKGFNLSRFNLYWPFLIIVIFAIGTHIFTDLVSSSAPNKYRKILGMTPLIISIVSISWFLILVREIAQQQETDRLNGANYANLFENPYLEHLAQLTSMDKLPYRAVMLVDYNDNVENINENPMYLAPYDIKIIDGYTVMYPLNYLQYWQKVLEPLALQNEECRYLIKLSRAYNRAYLSNHCEFSEPVIIDDPQDYFNMNLLSIAGVKYFISTNPIESDYLTEIDTASIICSEIPNCFRYYLYENENAFPFLFTQHSVIMKPDTIKTLHQVRSLDLETLQDNVVLDQSQQQISIKKLAEGQVDISLSIRPGYILDIDYTSETPQILIINSAFNSSWIAEIDGEIVPAFPAYHLLTGVYVPEGSHTITFYYYPDYLAGRIFNNALEFIYP